MFSYLHIPFCRQKCHYCKFALTPVFDAMKVRTYMDALKKEIDGFFKASSSPTWSGISWVMVWDSRLRGNDGLGNGNDCLKSIYFGGGTPSILAASEVSELIGIFRDRIAFAPDIEITLEANPEDITADYVGQLADIGVNRISLGVQTLSDRSLQTVGRTDSGTVLRALEMIVKGKIENISVDLIAGLPHTRLGDTRKDAEILLDRFPIRHMSVYMLENSLYPAEWKNVSLSEEEVVQEYLDARALLLQKGFVQYELSNFALSGYESKHNRAYWNHSNVRGFGLSAAGYWGWKRFANSASFAGYYRGEREYEEILDEDAKRIERIMFGLRTSGVSVDDVGNRETLERFIAEGALEVRDDRIFPTSTWIFLLDHIMGELI